MLALREALLVSAFLYALARLLSPFLNWEKRESYVQTKFLVSSDCVFDASLVPETCPDRLVDLKGLINKFMESRVVSMGRRNTQLEPTMH